MTRRYEVKLTAGAEGDLELLYDWMTENRSAEQADGLLDAILEIIATLEHYPERGAIPKELEMLGVRDFRQMLLAPYRLIYRVLGETVYILLVADGRRDMRSLLEQRLLRD